MGEIGLALFGDYRGFPKMAIAGRYNPATIRVFQRRSNQGIFYWLAVASCARQKAINWTNHMVNEPSSSLRILGIMKAAINEFAFRLRMVFDRHRSAVKGR